MNRPTTSSSRRGKPVMAIDTTRSASLEYPGEEGVGAPRPSATWRRSEWLRPNILWAIAGAVVGYLIGHWLGNVIASGYQQTAGASDQNDVAIVLGLSLGVVGWMAGIGGLNYPLAKILGYELAPPPPEKSWVRYFRMTDDHKVVGCSTPSASSCSSSPADSSPCSSAPSCSARRTTSSGRAPTSPSSASTARS